jgi:uncharacterized membrane protein
MWVIYALLSAFFVATTDPIAKRSLLSKRCDEYLVGYFAVFFSVPFLYAYAISGSPIELNSGLVKSLAVAMPLEVLATVLYYKALKATDISLSVPFIALTPVFIIITGFFMLGERVSPYGILGILLITAGVYSINIKEAKYGFIYPLKAVFFNRGSFYMVIVAFIYSLTSVLCKKVMIYSDLTSAPFLYNFSIVIAMAPLMAYRLFKGHSRLKVDSNLVSYIAMGALSALSSLCFFKAFTMTSVAYVISIKRLSLLMSIGYGWFFFRERDIHIRFLSTFCMLVGVVLILLTG